ncbi:MAG: hypothetical protein E7270_06940 [Lachnospiraceae bacterium]|nr:hypothetical protein [Lachnospiraceae bacterium]
MRNKIKFIVAWILCFVMISNIILPLEWTPAATITVIISGNNLDENVYWDVPTMVKWNATAFDGNTPVDLVSGTTIEWESSDPKVIMLSNQSATGNISSTYLQAVGAGTATITATLKSEDEFGNLITATASKTITVTLEVKNAPVIVFEDSDSPYQVNTNSNNSLTWTSSNVNVATVVEQQPGIGTIQYTGSGVTVIKCTTADGKQTQQFEVCVNAKFTEEFSEVTIPYMEDYQLQTNSGGYIVYESADPDIVSVNTNGIARGITAGRTTITISAVDETNRWYQYITKRTLPVFVDFKIISSHTYLAVGDRLTLSTNVNENYASSVNWSSSDTSIVEVDNEGVVTAKKKGEATIRATISNQDIFGTVETKWADIKLTVVDSLSLSATEYNVKEGETFDITCVATDGGSEVEWSIHKSKDGPLDTSGSIITITENEEDNFTITVTGISKGEAWIKATQQVSGITRSAWCKVYVRRRATDIEISETEKALTLGQQYPLFAVVYPADAYDTTVKWTTSDPSIVTVDQTGKIKAVGTGEAIVSVSHPDIQKQAYCKVTVTKPISKIILSDERVEADLEDVRYQLSYTIEPEEENVNRDVIWSSSKPDVADVSQEGMVTFLKPGTVTIIVQTLGVDSTGKNLFATCEFIIRQPVTKVEFDSEYSNIIIKVGEKLKVANGLNIYPDDATDKSITWETSNGSIAKVDDMGYVTGVKAGTCVITAQSNDSGIFAKCTVKVYQNVTGLKLSATEYITRKGDYFILEVNTEPANADNQTFLWETKDKDIVELEKSDKNQARFYAKEAGETKILVTSKDPFTGDTIVAECKVTVEQAVTGVTLNSKKRTIKLGKKIALTATVKPASARNKNVTWSSSDESVASVENGVVTAKKGGTAIITVTTEEGSQVAHCKITVKEMVTSIELTGKSHYLNYGKKMKLVANVQTSTATNKAVKWSTTNKKKLTVTQKGVVKGVGYGTAYIRAKAKDGSGVMASYRIRVIRPVKKITITPSRVNIYEGKAKQLKAKITPSNASIRNLKWTSSDPSVATVDETGEIVAVSAGRCNIYATSTDGSNVKGMAKVVVKKRVEATSIKLNSSKLTMLRGQRIEIEARMLPRNSTDSYKWYSTDKTVATVNSKGVVTAKGQGSCEIIVVSTLSGVEASCTINVIALNATTVTLEQYDYFDLDVLGDAQSTRWLTSNRRVAVVSSSGMITAKMAGTAIISAKVNGKVLTCKVRVVTMKK